MHRKSNRPKTPVARNESIRRRHCEIRHIGNRFQCGELNSVRLRSLQHRSRLHIHRIPAIRRSQTFFLLPVGDRAKTHQRSLPRSRVRPRSIPGIHHHARLDHVRHLQPRIQRPGKSHRNHPLRSRLPNHRFCRPPRCLRSNPTADHSRRLALKNSVSPSVVTNLADSPPSNQRPHFPFHRRDDRNTSALTAALPIRAKSFS